MYGKKDEVKAKEYPSHFGSHSSMVDAEETGKLKDEYVACRDNEGIYYTERWRLDNGLSDPNRYTERRLNKLLGRDKEESVK